MSIGDSFDRVYRQGYDLPISVYKITIDGRALIALPPDPNVVTPGNHLGVPQSEHLQVIVHHSFRLYSQLSPVIQRRQSPLPHQKFLGLPIFVIFIDNL